MSAKNENPTDKEPPVKKKGVRTAVDVQKYKLDKLMENPVSFKV